MKNKTKKIPEDLMKFLFDAQRNELTESIIYHKLSKLKSGQKNANIFEKISQEEKKHHDIWQNYTKVVVKPNMFRVRFFVFLTRFLWLSFGIKLMERWEVYAQNAYYKLKEYIPETAKIQHDEESHEKELIGMIDDKWLSYIWSIVLWLNDALVELTWVLAWLTLGLQDPKLIAVVWLITWISASMSMWASEYLSTKAEWWENAFTSSMYTRAAYFITVVFLILSFLLINNPFVALPITLWVAITIIAIFNWYLSIAKDLSFKHRFWEMVWISIWVAIISFGIGLLVRNLFGLDV